MTTSTPAPHAGRLFHASCMALIVTALAFAIRGGFLSQWQKEFHLTAEQLGWVSGTAFWGFTLSMVIGGSLCDVIGMRRLVWVAFSGHLVGILATLFAQGFWSLFFSTLVIGLANGCVEATCNPLVAALYPDNKTTKLNHFHAWWPGGLVIGGLVTYFMDQAGLGWRAKMATMLAPAIIYGLMFRGEAFPQTERVSSGVSTGAMFKECLRPLFLFLLACMCLTAITENGTNQFIVYLLERSVPDPILVLVWVTGLMTVGRLFAGPVVHKLSPVGMLLFSAVFSVIGLFWLSQVQGQVAFVAAIFYAMGICYFWPTMLGFVNERLPKTGALGLALMGGVGMLASSFALPLMGRTYDQAAAAALPAGLTLEAAKSAAAGSPAAAGWAAAQLAGGSAVLATMAFLPVALIVLFSALALQQRGKPAERL